MNIIVAPSQTLLLFFLRVYTFLHAPINSKKKAVFVNSCKAKQCFQNVKFTVSMYWKTVKTFAMRSTYTNY